MVDSNGACISCEQGLTLYFGRCVFYQTFCNTFSDDNQTSGICSKVPPGFSLTKNSVVVSQSADTWDSRGNILTCNGELVLKDQMCISIIIGCAVYDQFTNCQQCYSGYALIKNQCAPDASICINRINNSCTQCVSGFIAYNGTCFSLQNNVAGWDAGGKPIAAMPGYVITSIGISLPLSFNCKQSDALGLSCLECLDNYTNLNGKCVNFIPNCTSYNIRGICQSCSGGLTLISGLCRNTSLCELLDGNQCITCEDGARLMSGICIPNFKESNCY